MNCNYRIILSIDGGGMLGIIPLRILDFIHSHISKEFNEPDSTAWVDLFASTSSSSIFTGALMLKDENKQTIYSPGDLLNFYIKRGAQVFAKNTGNNSLNSRFPLSFILNHFFGNVSMLDLSRHFLFVCYNKKLEECFAFSTSTEKYFDLPLSKVMMACTAAENIFPPVVLGSEELIDASFRFQNPSLRAYNYARMIYPEEQLILLSIGSGFQACKKGKLQSEEAEEELENISSYDRKLHYFRYQPKLIKDYPNPTNYARNVSDLLEFTDDFIQENKSRFDELFELMLLKTL
jgi:patatin-like phospholipase/acyl hydrolase